MTPSSAQILRTASLAIKGALQKPEAVDTANLLNGVDTLLDELLLREDDDFYPGLYQEGLALARQGARLYELGGSSAMLAEHGDFSATIDALRAHNVDLAASLDRMRTPEADDLVQRISEWELRLLSHPDAGPKVVEASDTSRDLMTGERLQTYLRAARPEWAGVWVTGFKIQPGGNSKLTALAQCHDAAFGDFGLAVRAEPPRRFMALEGMDVRNEFPVVCFAHEMGLFAPEPLLLETDPRHLGMPFILSRRVAGRIKGSFMGAADRVPDRNIRDIIAVIVRIAQASLDARTDLLRASHLGRWLDFSSMRENTKALVEYWYDAGVAGNMTGSVTLARGIDWLLTNLPEDEEPVSFIHGDIGFHNILFDGDELLAVLDWENSRIGDPAEELANFIMGSLNEVSRDEILRMYRELGGRPISEYRLRYFEVYTCVKMIIAALVSLRRVDERPEGGLAAAVFGLRSLSYYGLKMAELIRLAEDAR